MSASDQSFEYVGFWARAIAMLIDTIVLVVVTWPILLLVYDVNTPIATADMATDTAYIVISYVLPTIAVIFLWRKYRATPGKMLFKAEVVDATTHEAMSVGQLVLRYFAYILSSLPLCLGFLWVAFDSRKQAWHDKLAGTVVIRRIPVLANSSAGIEHP
ncbi:MAG: putative RDD family membrane protein YckC [Bermanella sp.]|jgi:uncharacterized RDD family membrane protein YckC